MSDDQLDTEVGRSEAKVNDATQTATGMIAGQTITVSIVGPEAQDLDEDDDRIGSDVLMSRVDGALSNLKSEVEKSDE